MSEASATGTSTATLTVQLDGGRTVHSEGWGHFTEGQEKLPVEFERAGVLDQLAPLAPGAQVELPGRTR